MVRLGCHPTTIVHSKWIVKIIELITEKVGKGLKRKITLNSGLKNHQINNRELNVKKNNYCLNFPIRKWFFIFVTCTCQRWDGVRLIFALSVYHSEIILPRGHLPWDMSWRHRLTTCCRQRTEKWPRGWAAWLRHWSELAYGGTIPCSSAASSNPGNLRPTQNFQRKIFCTRGRR